MFRKAAHEQKQMWCRMLISRACTAADVFCHAVRLRMIQP